MKNISVVLIAILMTMSMAHASELTPEYLLGEWCFESIDSGSQVTKENKNWVFEKDGKFLMQQSKHSKKIKHSGFWDIKDKKLRIKPVYMGGYKVVEIVSQDKFIFKWSGDVHVVRGGCK